MKSPTTEHLIGQLHGSQGPGYKKFAKRLFWKGNRRAAKSDPMNAPRKVTNKGWA